MTEQRTDKGARTLLVIASLVVVIAGIKAAATLILPFLIAIFLALISLPMLNWLQKRGCPTGLAVVLTVIVAVVAMLAIGLVFSESIKGFTAAAPRYRARLVEMFSGVTSWLAAQGIDTADRTMTDLFHPARAMDLVTGTLVGAASVLSKLLMVFLTIVFILFEAAGFPAKLQAAFGDHGSSERFEKIKQEIQRYLGTKTALSLATGGLAGAATAIIGVDFPLLWGALAFMLNYIPTLGSIIAAIPPMLLALVQLGPGQALAVGLVFLGINVTLGNLVEPYLMGRRLGLSTLVVFVSLVFWGWIWGPVGMLLSVPLTMILKIMLENTEDLRWVAVLLSPSPHVERRTAKAD